MAKSRFRTKINSALYEGAVSRAHAKKLMGEAANHSGRLTSSSPLRTLSEGESALRLDAVNSELRRSFEKSVEVKALATSRSKGFVGLARRVLAGPKANLRLLRMARFKKSKK